MNTKMQILKPLALLISFFLIAPLAQGYATSGPEWEYAQKAKIIKYLVGAVDWPSSVLTDNVVNVCLMGDITDIKSITDINGAVVNKRKIIIRKSPNLQNALDHCQLVYISNSQSSESEKIIHAFAGKPVLLLGDMDHFAQNGGSMNFVVLKELVALTVNVETLKNSHLGFDMSRFSQMTVIPTSEELK